MNKYILYLLSLLLLVFTSFQGKNIQKTFLAIVAHPDDETAIGPALIKKDGERNKMIVMIATDGKTGIRVANVPAGDSLWNMRKLESICASERMGLAPPIFYRLTSISEVARK